MELPAASSMLQVPLGKNPFDGRDKNLGLCLVRHQIDALEQRNLAVKQRAAIDMGEQVA